jgi:hypothetical protein
MLSWDCSLHWLYIIRIQYENTGVKSLGLQSWPSPKYWGKISGVAVLTILTPPQPHPHPEIDDRILKVQDCDQIKIVWTPNMGLEPTTTRLKVERSSNWANSVSMLIPECAQLAHIFRSVPGFEPGTSCTRSRNHTTRPNGRWKLPLFTPNIENRDSTIALSHSMTRVTWCVGRKHKLHLLQAFSQEQKG